MKPSPYLKLLPEIRKEIHQLVLPFTDQLHIKSGVSSIASTPLIDVNQQIRMEVLSLFFHTRAFHLVVKSPEDLYDTVNFLHDLKNVFPGHLRIFKADILDYFFVTFSTLSRVPSKLTHVPVQAAEDERAAYTKLTYLDNYMSIEWGLDTLVEQVQQLPRDHGFDPGYVARFFRRYSETRLGKA